jgi:hypothetical protein
MEKPVGAFLQLSVAKGFKTRQKVTVTVRNVYSETGYFQNESVLSLLIRGTDLPFMYYFAKKREKVSYFDCPYRSTFHHCSVPICHSSTQCATALDLATHFHILGTNLRAFF